MRTWMLTLVTVLGLAGTVSAQTTPVANAGPDVEVGCTGQAGTPINLNGMGSSVGAEFSYRWTAPGVTLNNATSLTPIGVFPVGATEVTLTVTSTDPATGAQLQSSDTVLVVVSDPTPPMVLATPNPALLWPPNHKLRKVHVDLFVFDACDARPEIELVSIESSEPDNGRGDGNTSGDIAGADVGTDDRNFLLRAERAGPGSGRTYSAVYRATDEGGNTSDTLVTVLVPHDRGKGKVSHDAERATKKEMLQARKAAVKAARAQVKAVKQAAKLAQKQYREALAASR